MEKGHNTTEQSLIRRCQSGETAAFAILINEHRRHLFSYLYRLSLNKTTAEDLLQETLLKVWQAMPRCQPDGNFRGWLFRIAYNTVIDDRRKSRRLQYTDSYPEQVDGHNPHGLVENDEQKILLEKALAGLTDKQRHVFLLRQHSELSFKAIAELTNEPLNTVLSHMNYAVRKLKKHLQEYYDVKA